MTKNEAIAASLDTMASPASHIWSWSTRKAWSRPPIVITPEKSLTRIVEAISTLFEE